MNDKIKEKQLNEVLYGLDYIGNKIKNDDGKLELGVNNCKLLLDYITNLQQENERLESNNQAMQEEMSRTWEKENNYKSRIEKAVEYLTKEFNVEKICRQQLSLIKCKNKLEDILNGRSDE